MRFVVPFLAFVLVLSGCGKGGFSKGAAGRQDHFFAYPMPNYPTELDPATVEDGDTIDLLEQIYEGLVQWTESSELMPNLAEEWEISEDRLTYTFHIKRGVKFHSGREMTAHDVKFSWDRAANPGLASPTVDGYMADLVGFREVREKVATEMSGVRVLDDYTLEVRLKEPKVYWPLYLRYPCYYVVDRDVVPADREIRRVEEVGATGPFMLTELEPKYATLTRFEDYHLGPAKLAEIRRPFVEDAQTRFAMYESGEMDWLQLERQDLRAVEADPELKKDLLRVPRPAIWYLGFDLVEYPPFAKKKVRQAFAMAVDKEAIINELFQGANELAGGIIPPGVPGYRPDFKGLPYDPPRARQLLAEAGYPGGKGMPPLELYYRVDRDDPRLVSERVQLNLKENLGVEVGLRPLEWDYLLDLRNKGKLPFFHLRWHADYLDPQNFLSFMLHTNARENMLDYSNPEFDRLCDEADREFDQARRIELYHQAEEIAVLEDAIWVPIYFQYDLELLRSEVTGLRRSGLGPLPHWTTDVTWAKN